MATVTKFPGSNALITTGWTTPNNAHADDGSYTTCAPAKSASVVTDYYNFGFGIPTGSTINSITFEVQYKSSTTGSTGATLTLQTILNTTLRGTAVTGNMNLSDTTVNATTAGTWTVSELNDNTQAGGFKLRLSGKRSTSNTAITWSVDYVKATVDYTPPPTTMVAPLVTASGALKVPTVTAKQAKSLTAPKVTASADIKVPTVVIPKAYSGTAPKVTASATLKLPTVTAKQKVSLTAPKTLASGSIMVPTVSAKQSATLAHSQLLASATLRLPTLDVRSKIVLTSPRLSASADIKVPTLRLPKTVVASQLSASATLRLPTLDVRRSVQLSAPPVTASAVVKLPTVLAKQRLTLIASRSTASATLKPPTLDIRVTTRIVAPALTASGTVKIPTLDVRRVCVLTAVKVSATTTIKAPTVRTQSFVVLAAPRLAASATLGAHSVVAKQAVTVIAERLDGVAIWNSADLAISAMVSVPILNAVANIGIPFIRTSDNINLYPALLRASAGLILPDIHIIPELGFISVPYDAGALQVTGTVEEAEVRTSHANRVVGSNDSIIIRGGYH